MYNSDNKVDAMNFKFDNETAICVDPVTGELLLFCDDFIEICEQHSEHIFYACNQVFTALDKFFDITEGKCQEVAEEMRIATNKLVCINDKLAQFINTCKNRFMDNKDYVFDEEIEYLLSDVIDIADKLMNDAYKINRVSLCNESYSLKLIFNLREDLSSKEYLSKYQLINSALEDLCLKAKNKLNNIVTLSDNIAKTTEAA